METCVAGFSGIVRRLEEAKFAEADGAAVAIRFPASCDSLLTLGRMR